MPRSMKWAAGLCIALSFFMMVKALGEVGALLEIHVEPPAEPAPADFGDALQIELARTSRSAFKDHRELRILVLLLLSGACGLTFAGATRILRPFGLRREPLRRLLSRAAMAVAILRTLDGAQYTGTMKAVGASVGSRVDRIPFYAEFVKSQSAELSQVGDPKEFIAFVISAFAVLAPILLTLLMVTPFVVFWRYFGSEKAREIIAHEDAKLPDSRV